MTRPSFHLRNLRRQQGEYEQWYRIFFVHDCTKIKSYLDSQSHTVKQNRNKVNCLTKLTSS